MANPGAKSVTFGGKTTSVPITCTNCSVSNATSSNNNVVTVTRSGNTLTLTSAGNAGTSATITVTGTGNTNYNNPGQITFTASIIKADQAAPTAKGKTTYYPTVATATATGGGGHGLLGWTNGYSLNKVGYLDTSAYWTGTSNYNRSPNSNKVRITVK